MTNPVATFEQISVRSDLWSLGSRLGIIETAEAWRTLAGSAGTRADSLADGARNLLSSGWAGAARDSFAAHFKQFVKDLELVQSESAALARHADGLAELTGNYQEFLNQSFTSVSGVVPITLVGDQFVLSPRTEAEAEAARAAVSQASELRAEFDQALAAYPAKFTTGGWSGVSSRWSSIVRGAADPFDLPPGATGTSVMWVDGEVVVNTGTGDDDVNVRVDPDTGQVVVEVNGVERRYPPGTPITVRAGEGADVIEVADGVGVELTLLGGAGNDQIHGGGGGDAVLGGHGKDDLFGGDGNDYLSGGSGIDYVEGQGGRDRVAGGHGDDTLYGLGGDDYLSGGDGDDYIEGGKGNDTIDGGAGGDVLSGGRGDDAIRGGSERDVIYAGHGRDTVDGGSAVDTAYTQDGDRVDRAAGVTVEVTSDAGFINIEGSPEFIARVTADLDMMRASPTAQQMLAELQDLRDPNRLPGEHTLTIRELSEENGYANRGSPSMFGNRDSEISYNPGFTFDQQQGRPAVVLYHEMAHVYSYWNGNVDDDLIVGGPDDGVKIAERQATGLPIDHDDDPGTPDRIDPEQPLDYTENGLRDEMDLPNRDNYR